MLGWNISVHSQTNGGGEPAKAQHECEISLATCQTGLRGIDWLDDLVKRSDAIELRGTGYPSLFTAKAMHILPLLSPKPPMARDVWQCDPDDILTEKWDGRTVLNTQAISECSPEEWLLVVAWDES